MKSLDKPNVTVDDLIPGSKRDGEDESKVSIKTISVINGMEILPKDHQKA